eukprot:NODE_626_length_1317_cov_85.642017_g587_i0.p1 GENE.NODE_626_length_1317_cov_85.642017_g587_i0~~NODE_626_length_1317_cov_85.642017_g587_i0.p1  ORF type:complete len:355 (-),score=22.89 NODE_626_length_1317_cov_85.642017_g587_i0:132-1196(-)
MATPVRFAQLARKVGLGDMVEENQKVKYWDQIVAMLAYSFSSVGMLVINKLAVDAFTAPAVLVILQSLGTLLFLFAIPSVRREVQPLESDKMRKWTPVVAFFTLMIFASLKSLAYLHVSTVLIFRNLGSVLTTLAEWQCLGQTVQTRVVLSLIFIVFGTVMYGWNAPLMSGWGIFWILLNVLAQVGYTVYVKYLITRVRVEMTRYGMSFYNTVMSLPPLLLLAAALGEYSELIPKTMPEVSMWGWVAVAISCIISFFISTTGFQLQRLVSATTYMVVSNMNKLVVVFFGMVFLGDSFAGWMDVTGCAISLGSGGWYSYERYRQSEVERKERYLNGQPSGEPSEKEPSTSSSGLV